MKPCQSSYGSVCTDQSCPACKKALRNAKARANRKVRDQIMRDLGLTKVRGAVSGRTYWE